MLRYRMASWLCAIIFAMLSGIVLQAGEPSRPVQQQVREFDILVDGSHVGSSRLEIAEHSDGRTVATTDAHISINVFFFTYVHRYQGSESWQAGQPRKLEGLTQAGTDRRIVRAVLEATRSEVSVDENPQPAGPAVHLTTSYWYWPVALDKLKAISLLDVDSGATIKAECERIGEESIVVGTRTINCTHYRLKGASETDLWFDADRQLVSRKSIEVGHRTELRLQSIKRIEVAQPTAAGKSAVPKL
ncbi:MAG: uncharacterized protein JWN70_6112 [Planctomycetaceae bacterium]|nr:uncharacterized protein [Planctomycetaceae bacterium]